MSMDSLSRNIKGFLQATRIPNLLVMAAIQILSALFILNKEWSEILSIPFLILIMTTLMIAAAGYIINDYHDQKIDMINRPDKVVVGVTLKRRLALVSHALLSIAAIYLGFRIDPVIGLIHLFSSFSLWYYSNTLRRLPFIGNLVIATLSGLIILVVGIFYRETHTLIMIYSFFAFLISLIREIIKDIEDVKGEAAFGCSTIPVIWGIRGAKIVILLISISGSIYLGYFLLALANTNIRLFFLCITPLFIWFIWLLFKSDTKKQYRTLRYASNWIILLGMLSIVLVE